MIKKKNQLINNTKFILTNEQLIQKYEGTIVSLASQFSNTISSINDLYQEGALAILKAKEHYDPSKGPQDNYFKRAIRNNILKRAIETSFNVHIPSGSFTKLYKNKEYSNSKYRQSTYNIYQQEIPNSLLRETNKEFEFHEIIKLYDKQNIGHMNIIESYSVKEIAEKIGWKTNKVRKVLKKIRAKVGDAIKDDIF